MSDELRQFKQNFHLLVCELQNEISKKISDIDPKISVKEDLWKRKDFLGNDGGGGITRAFEGKVIENAGVNTSKIFGEISPEFAKKLNSKNSKIWAAGISLIIHPFSPKIPTTHANFRMIHSGDKFWFGGGADLTPYYPIEEDFKYFHGVWKNACEAYGNYDEFKLNCDKYFVNLHRDSEMRGIGGIFFDYFNSDDLDKDFNMVKVLSSNFINSYFPIVEKRVSEEWNDEDEEFFLHRRGRYVEFNLLHDRGTKFGLETNGRTDSILISLPKRCKFTYQYSPKKGSVHEKMLKYYFPRDWA